MPFKLTLFTILIIFGKMMAQDSAPHQLTFPKGITLEEALKFKNLILEKKFFMAALIDPFLAPVSDLVESILLYVFQTT